MYYDTKLYTLFSFFWTLDTNTRESFITHSTAFPVTFYLKVVLEKVWMVLVYEMLKQLQIVTPDSLRFFQLFLKVLLYYFCMCRFCITTKLFTISTRRWQRRRSEITSSPLFLLLYNLKENQTIETLVCWLEKLIRFFVKLFLADKQPIPFHLECKFNRRRLFKLMYET